MDTTLTTSVLTLSISMPDLERSLIQHCSATTIRSYKSNMAKLGIITFIEDQDLQSWVRIILVLGLF